MAHFALVENNVVTNILVVANDNCGGGTFPASEPVGQAYISSLGFEGDWKQCSYNNNFRKQYPYVGFTYDSISDVFVAWSPFASWILDENHDWEAPIPKPNGNYWWNETNQEWVLYTD